MKIELVYKAKPVTVDFDPAAVAWKSQNFGQYSNGGIKFPGLGHRVFIKRHKGAPDSQDFLCELSAQDSPCAYIPDVYGFYELDGAFTHYIFMEMVQGVPLLENVKEVKKDDCYEILRSVFFALQAIVERDHWYPDLDFRNVMFDKSGGTPRSWLIDIDSCLPDSTGFVNFLRNRGVHTNVNERYWGCVVPMAKERENFENLSGKTVTQAAFVYFAIDLYFRTSYTENFFNLKPKDIFKLVESPNQHIDKDSQEMWQDIHEEMAENPEDGCRWEALDEFATSLFGFTEALNPPEAGKGIWDSVLEMTERLFSFLKPTVGRME